VITYTLLRREFVLTEVFSLKNENISLVKSLYALEASNYFGSLLPLTRKELTERGVRNYSSDFYHCLNLKKDKVSLIICVFKLALSVDRNPDIVTL